MRSSLKNLSVKELAAYISGHLSKYNIKVVLTGGSCVTIYSINKYKSYDLDFVTNAVENSPKILKKAMEEIGFILQPQHYFAHKDCKYVIEFMPPPLAIGDELIKETNQIRLKIGTLKLLKPTDCVKDRLAAYFYWDDKQSLEQALLVARKQIINLKEIKRWAKKEGQIKKFNDFLSKIKK